MLHHLAVNIARRRDLCLLVGLGIAVLWAYWPTLLQLQAIWNRQADYSHGYLVPPLAAAFLWFRIDRRPQHPRPHIISGLIVLGTSCLLRWIGLRYSFDSLDGYSLIVCVLGAVLAVGGRSTVAWAWPSIGFLVFMVPLPFQVERLLSVPLQRVATTVSCYVLQCLGQPAFAEGTTILIGVHELSIAQECSGLRMFIGAFALAFAYLMFTRRELWEQAFLLCSVVPIALVANSLRIVAIGLLYQAWGNTESVRHWSHEMAGWFMIPFAAILFALVLVYMSRVMRAEYIVGLDELMAPANGLFK